MCLDHVGQLTRAKKKKDKCKDAFIGKYYPPAKIIQLRSNIMNFRQLDNEHISQAWERMKTLVKNFPTHGLTTWMVIQILMHA